MIMLEVADYCQNCPHFSPTTEVVVLFGDNMDCLRNTTVVCRDRDRCKCLYDDIVENLAKKREEE